MSEERVSISNRYKYLSQLEQDPMFQKLVLEPLRKDLEAFEARLKSFDSSESEMRIAQGVMHLYSNFLRIFKLAKQDFEQAVKQKKL